MHAMNPPRRGRDADQGDTAPRVFRPGESPNPGRHGRKASVRMLRMGVLLSTLIFVTVPWLDEFLDLPRLLFNAPSTPANFLEALLESAVMCATGLVLYHLLFRLLVARTQDEQERKRDKILSEILLNESPTMFLASDPDGTIIVASKFFIEKSGYRREEIIGKNHLALLVPPPEREEVSRKLEELLRLGTPVRGETHIVTKDGKELLLQWEARVAYREDGEVDFIYGPAVDITEQRALELVLRRSEERYRLLAENITDVIWATDAEFRFTYVSPSSVRLSGFTAEEVMAQQPGEPYTKESMELFQSYLAKVKGWFAEGIAPEGERLVVLEAQRYRKDGSTIWVEIKTNLVYDENGRPAGLVGMTRDITARKQTEEALRRSEEQYRLLAENAKDVIWAVDTDIRFTYVSPSAEKMFGYTAEEVMDKPFGWAYTKESRDVNLALLEQARRWLDEGFVPEDKRTMTFEAQRYRKDGSTIWVEITTNVLLGEKGRPVGIVGVTRDISDRKRGEESLRRSEEMYRTIFASTGTAMVIVEEDGTFSLVNEETEKLSGYAAGEIVGRMHWKEFITPEGLERLTGYNTLRKIDPGAAPKNYEFRAVTRGGKIKDIFATASLLPGTKRILLSMLDITRSKKDAEKLRLSQEHLRNLFRHAQDVRERERTRVAREIHDELGQVLTGLKLDLSFLARKLPAELTELVTKTNLMLRFVDMTIQSVKRITMDLRPGVLDHLGLVAAIQWQAEEFQKRTGIRCRMSVTPEEIILEPEQSTTVFRIFQETLTNISKYARATEVDIVLIEHGGSFEMTVADNGVGITKEQMENPRSFGLMGIQERASFSGGTARITGEKGKGTTVMITIPIDQTRSIDDTSAYRG